MALDHSEGTKECCWLIDSTLASRHQRADRTYPVPLTVLPLIGALRSAATEDLTCHIFSEDTWISLSSAAFWFQGLSSDYTISIVHCHQEYICLNNVTKIRI